MANQLFTVASLLCIGNLALIATASVYILAIVPLILLSSYGIQKFYLRTSRQLRFMDLEAKSPL